jgi:hypothetical protein
MARFGTMEKLCNAVVEAIKPFGGGRLNNVEVAAVLAGLAYTLLSGRGGVHFEDIKFEDGVLTVTGRAPIEEG